MRLISTVFCLALLVSPVEASQKQPDLKSRPERSDYKETSRYADVMEFIAGLQRLSAKVKVETFGTTNEGRALPLVILSDPATHNPIAAAASNKPVVFVMANIHAGEVEGKEAMQHLMRDVVAGPLASLLDKIILLVAPIYNADGNEKIDIKNRTAQNGPAGGVGVRENAQRLDLNRDFMKIASPEATGLITNVFNRWDPHVVIDLHTTNGSFHGYALTYSPALNPNTDQRLTAFARAKLFPNVTKTLKTRHKYNVYFYGNFVDERNPFNELSPEKSGDPKAWATFDYRPRFGNNYVGLRNRIAILSEAYSYLGFRSRIDVTDKFVRTILEYIAAHAAEVVNLIREVDRDAAATGTTRGNEEGFGVRFELKPSDKPVEILVGSVNRVMDPRTNRPRFEATGAARPVKMTEYGEFRATRRIKAPAAYLLKPEQRNLINKLLAHGIVVEATTQDETFDVERYRVNEFTESSRAFQGHKEVKLAVIAEPAQETFPAGSFIVSMHQPKAALIFYLLEPESDDGLANWNFLDQELKGAEKKVYPVYRLKAAPRVPRVVVRQ